MSVCRSAWYALPEISFLSKNPDEMRDYERDAVAKHGPSSFVSEQSPDVHEYFYETAMWSSSKYTPDARTMTLLPRKARTNVPRLTQKPHAESTSSQQRRDSTESIWVRQRSTKR
jgi:hypothetical protein